MVWQQSSTIYKKTKELCCGNQIRKGTAGLPYEQVIIKGIKIKQVSNFKYLGTIIDDKLSFQENVDHTQENKTAFRSTQEWLMIESILTYNIV